MATQTTTQGSDLSLVQAIEVVAREKGIDPTRLIQTVEDALQKAALTVFGAGRQIEAKLNEVNGRVDLFMYMAVVDDPADDEREIDLDDARRIDASAVLGDELGFQIFWHPADAKLAADEDAKYGDILNIKQARAQFGRIAAQTAKQVLVQRVRDEERDIIYNEFKDKKHELIRGTVRRFERGNNIVIDLDRAEGLLPYREQTPRETYRPGDRIVAWVKDIDREARGPQVILSRNDPKLVEKLFEQEVPEIYEGIVRIAACAREPGARSKIAVTSRDADVDPVGACVGMKGSRVQAVVQELRGEKIDIIPWDKDPARFVCAAIQPAEVNKVIVDEAGHRMELVVPDEKLSLAIGRKGQNVRLAAQLTGWELDIIPESKFREIENAAVADLQKIEGVDAERARNLYRQGFRAVDELAEASEEELEGLFGSAEEAKAMRGRASSALESGRKERLALARTAETLTEHDRLLLVSGIGDRTVQFLEKAGYRRPEDLDKEEEEKLAMKTGLGLRRAKMLKDAVKAFLATEWPEIQAAKSGATTAS